MRWRKRENQGKRDDALAGKRGRYLKYLPSGEGLAGQGKTLKGLGCSSIHTGCRSVMPLQMLVIFLVRTFPLLSSFCTWK